MQELLDRCCGLDVHKKSVTACIMVGSGQQMKKQVRTFSTFTEGIEDLGLWLSENNIEHVAIESTGIYWKPVFNILGDKFDLILVNARRIKNVPGRKTDVRDSEWICRLLKSGLIERSLIPPEEIRNLRDLNRYRNKLTASITAERNRIIKFLESANIKLSSVLSDVFGKSGTAIVSDIASGVTDPIKLANRVTGNVKASPRDFEKALQGRINHHTRFMIRQCLSHIDSLKVIINDVDQQIGAITDKHKEASEAIQEIPGVSETTARAIIGEIGTDMEQFQSAEHLAAWAGLAPGSYESAGKKKAQEYYRDQTY